MARWRKPSKEESQELRRRLAEKARAGRLRFPSAVVEIRRSFGMTQEEFGRVVGLTKRKVAEIEAGAANPTMDTIEKIGRLFGFAVGFVPKATDKDANSG